MRARLGLLWGSLSLVAGCATQCSAPTFESRPKLRSPEEFCRDWAASACSEEAVGNCQARSDEACRSSQARFCLSKLPLRFSDREGHACTDAVAAAYADGQLRGDELSIALQFGGPCERIHVGPRGRGERCKESNDCDRSADYDCVRKANAEYGSCEVPQPIGAGRDCRAPDLTCEQGFYCDGEHCIEAEGPDEPCKIHEQCGNGQYCSNESKCATRKGVGELCDDNVECGAGICNDFAGKRTCTSRIVLSRAEPICADLK